MTTGVRGYGFVVSGGLWGTWGCRRSHWCLRGRGCNGSRLSRRGAQSGRAEARARTASRPSRGTPVARLPRGHPPTSHLARKKKKLPKSIKKNRATSNRMDFARPPGRARAAKTPEPDENKMAPGLGLGASNEEVRPPGGRRAAPTKLIPL